MFDQDWPKQANQLSRVLNDSTAFLKGIGLEVSRPTRGQARTIRIIWMDDGMTDDNDAVLKPLSFSEPLPDLDDLDDDDMMIDTERGSARFTLTQPPVTSASWSRRHPEKLHPGHQGGGEYRL